jgi:hypothetical protein
VLRRFFAPLLTALAVGAGLLWSVSAAAQAPSDGGAAEEPPAKLPPWHDTVFFWDHTASAETLGVGRDVQSANPTYVMGVGTKALYFLQDEETRKLSLRLNVGLYRELTNSDSTTERGETTFSDTELSLAYSRRLLGETKQRKLSLDLRLPSLVLPTSRASYLSGRYLGAGVSAGLVHVTPLLEGRFEPALASTIWLSAGYRRWFARATVPTNTSLELTRMGPDGRSVPGDQLSGSSLVRDQLTFVARWSLGIGERVTWTTDFGVQPAWKYDLDEEVELCGVVATGCTTIEVGEDDTRYQLRTQFNTELSLQIIEWLSFDVGYNNAANQLGPDGRRRGMFYSPDAQFYAAVSFIPHELATSSTTQKTAFARPSHGF